MHATTLVCTHAHHAKNPPLKKKHAEACFKFASQHLDKLVKYWEEMVWSDKTKTELWMHHSVYQHTALANFI